MIVEKPTTPRMMEIDLSGPQGNAFFLLGTATRFARQLGMNEYEVLNEMRSGDYENLLEVFDKYFGDFVIMYR
jgi:hypothetical protein